MTNKPTMPFPPITLSSFPAPRWPRLGSRSRIFRFRFGSGVPLALLFLLGACAHQPSIQPRYLAGRAVAADTGRPLAGAHVTVSFVVDGSPWTGQTASRRYTVVTDSDGRFQLESPLDDRVSITVVSGKYKGAFDRRFPATDRVEGLLLRVPVRERAEEVTTDIHLSEQELRKLGHKFPPELP